MEAAADAQLLYDFLRMPTSPPPTRRPILVLGSNTCASQSDAADLHAAGLAPLVVFSGARELHAGPRQTEAEWLADAARRDGLPDSAVLLEPRTTNTGENIRFCRELLRERWGDSVDGKTYIVVQKPLCSTDPSPRSPSSGRARRSPSPRPPSPSSPTTSASIGMPFDAVVSAMVGDTQQLRFYSEVKDFQAAVDVPDAVWAASAGWSASGTRATSARGEE